MLVKADKVLLVCNNCKGELLAKTRHGKQILLLLQNKQAEEDGVDEKLCIYTKSFYFIDLF